MDHAGAVGVASKWSGGLHGREMHSAGRGLLMAVGFSLSTLLASIALVAGIGWFTVTALRRVLGARPNRFPKSRNRHSDGGRESRRGSEDDEC